MEWLAKASTAKDWAGLRERLTTEAEAAFRARVV
jgi:hypothetical protein